MEISPSMKTLLTRVLSATIALAVVAGLIFFLGARGAQLLCVIAVVLGTREVDRILFSQAGSSSLRWVFRVITILMFVFGNLYFSQFALVFALGATVFFSTSLLYQKSFENLEILSRFQSRGIVGTFYVGLLPSFAFQLLERPHGLMWFFALLSIVFAGDTFAYLVGWKFGKRLLMPQVSPKKTIEGSIGGLFGSILAGVIFSKLIPSAPLEKMILLGALVGAAGQMGDLFESMLKRVANQKDSGSLMPGHGGVLDRIDGVLFAAPLMYLGVLTLF